VPERERDTAGRARNARPRDQHGRPLPRDAVGVERVPEDHVLDPDEAVAEAQRLLDAGLPFPAHDVLEGVWKAAPPAERELWRALAQLAVGLTHAQRGNARGAVALLDRAADTLGRWTGPAPTSVDLDLVRTYAEHLARRIERSGLAGLTAADLRPRMRTLDG
jgi:uncharacterized protein